MGGFRELSVRSVGAVGTGLGRGRSRPVRAASGEVAS